MSESERNTIVDECFAYDDVLRRDGRFAGGEALQSPRNATTLRPAGSESSKKSTRKPKGYEMKYLCLIYQDESVALKLPRAEAEKIHGDYLAFTDEIKKCGFLLGNHGLQPTQTAITVRVRNGTVTTTDGPFAETKEQLGGYFLIDARDLNEAIQIAAKIPSARFGSIEVRPVWE